MCIFVNIVIVVIHMFLQASHNLCIIVPQVFVLTKQRFLRYDVPNNHWSELLIPMKPSYGAAMVLHKGSLLVLGGFDEDDEEPHDRIQMYNPATRKWSLEKTAMSTGLFMHWGVVVKASRDK